jgi:regulator of ribonuclease activity A
MLSVPDICDQFSDRIAIAEPLFRDFGRRLVFDGEIVTVKCFEDNSLVKEQVGKDGTGKVLVVDGGGSLRCALLGDMLAARACENGWQGIVIYGCVRDVEILDTIDLGVKALAAYPVRSNKRGEGQLNIAVRFAGVEFLPGGFVFADRNGVVVSGECPWAE